MSETAGIASPRLRGLARRVPSAEPAQAAEESCDLCSEPLEPEHRHLVDLGSRRLLCACRPCSLLFYGPAAGGGHFRLVPDRRLRVEDFELDDARWESLGIPVEMAFFFHNSESGQIAAFYPGPMGATESQLELSSWAEIQAANPVLGELEPDVEALLVNRAGGERGYFVVPISDCYDLVGLIRTRWRGLSGGQEVWEEIERFFAELERRAKPARRLGTGDRASPPAATAAGGGGEHAPWPT